MEFGYFTLSDNHYDNNPRTANQFITDIVDEAIYAEQLGMHSAWIGEHHFSTLGVLSCPDIVLARMAARTKHIRLAPAVTVLPLHHPIRVAEQWATLDLLSNGRVDFAAGRGYDRREYAPFGTLSFEDNRRCSPKGSRSSSACGPAEGRSPITGKYYDVRRHRDHAAAGAEADPDLRGVLLQALDRACRAARAQYHGRAVRGRDELSAGCARSCDIYHETCAKPATSPAG